MVLPGWLMSAFWLAVLGAIVLFGSRFAARAAAKA